MAQELISAAEVARTLNVSRSTVTRMALAGTLHSPVKSPGLRGARLFARDAVDCLAAQRKTGKE